MTFFEDNYPDENLMFGQELDCILGRAFLLRLARSFMPIDTGFNDSVLPSESKGTLTSIMD